MPGPAIVTATLMRMEGETMVQTDLGTLDRRLGGQRYTSRVVTPSDATALQVYPIFGRRWRHQRRLASGW